MQATSVPAQAKRHSELALRLAAFMNYLMRAGQRDFFRALADTELSITQVKCLHGLAWDEGEDRSIKDVAEELGVSLPAASRAIEGLVKRGLVERTEDSEDRRMKRIRATEAGTALVASVMEARLAGLESFVESLSERELKQLGAALEVLVDCDQVRARCPS